MCASCSTGCTVCTGPAGFARRVAAALALGPGRESGAAAGRALGQPKPLRTPRGDADQHRQRLPPGSQGLPHQSAGFQWEPRIGIFGFEPPVGDAAEPTQDVALELLRPVRQRT